MPENAMMAGVAVLQNAAEAIIMDESDYGSDLDLDETTVDRLFSQLAARQLSGGIATPDIEQPLVILDDLGDGRPLARPARIRDNLSAAIVGFESTPEALGKRGAVREASVEVEYDEGNRSAFSREFVLLWDWAVKLTGLTRSAL
jgi:exonuclease V